RVAVDGDQRGESGHQLADDGRQRTARGDRVAVRPLSLPIEVEEALDLGCLAAVVLTAREVELRVRVRHEEFVGALLTSGGVPAGGALPAEVVEAAEGILPRAPAAGRVPFLQAELLYAVDLAHGLPIDRLEPAARIDVVDRARRLLLRLAEGPGGALLGREAGERREGQGLLRGGRILRREAPPAEARVVRLADRLVVAVRPGVLHVDRRVARLLHARAGLEDPLLRVAVRAGPDALRLLRRDLVHEGRLPPGPGVHREPLHRVVRP